ncbi:MAG: hypothetical protein QNJ20_02860 [Paracoccaceae bacterium]|nr:hypothetical protein [Paracoccaceae bacterium]
MNLRTLLPAVALALSSALPISAETVTTENGGDTFTAGETVIRTLDADRDVFAAGRSTTVLGRAGGDMHASGFDVKMDADVTEDAYAAGATVTVTGEVGQDLSAAGFTVRLEASGKVGGNARLMGATVSVEAPIEGALSATGRDVYLNAPVSGDARVFARTLRFGPEARIDGRLTYSTEEEMSVPERVAAADRVRFEPADFGKVWDEFEDVRDMPILPTFASMFFGFLVTLLFFIVLGAIALSFFPKRLETLRTSITTAFGESALLGVVGLSLLFGAIPVTAMTIIGLPFVPILVLCIIVAWTLAYALGAYAVATHLWFGLGGEANPAKSIQLLIFAFAIVTIALLNFIPFVGWVANYTLVLFGLGAMTRALFGMVIHAPSAVLDVDMKSPNAE